MDNQPVFAGRVKCPFCGYIMPAWYEADAESKGVWVQCKGKHCKKKFELKIGKTK